MLVTLMDKVPRMLPVQKVRCSNANEFTTTTQFRQYGDPTMLHDRDATLPLSLKTFLVLYFCLLLAKLFSEKPCREIASYFDRAPR